MRKRQEGSAMVLVMCVMVVVMALSFALLLSASVLSMNAIRSNQKEQCRIAAISVSDALRDEIETHGKYTTRPREGGNTSTLAGKLHTVFSTDWIRYQRGVGTIQQIQIDTRGVYHYEMTHEDMPSTKTTVQMYWEQEEEEDPNPEDEIQVVEEKLRGVTLYIKVTCQVGEEASTITSIYSPESIKYNESGDDFSWEWSYEGHDWEGRNG